MPQQAKQQISRTFASTRDRLTKAFVLIRKENRANSRGDPGWLPGSEIVS